MSDLIVDWFIGLFLWGTGALLIKGITLNKCNPHKLNEHLVALIGLLFWVAVAFWIAN
ncbi:hypothetical protein ACI2S3_16550 [Ralstonia nicotianae]|uniref:hypothetical protein n=1 Tax=Ralstonia solanacearum species complex TaxID=3116862 RepID=UPI0013F4C57D|nr:MULTISPECIES: hypothetical protein [Ralstonia solanacearum species complex]QIK22186.1 hypothetical protein G7939_01380 [Ralstonia solanacearum]MCK4134105.1 hypothetical protein [Ralstonia pseudosolanacearum]MCK4145400.1 hypothetical protein [Ralstonia pseudosolanacearum]MCK4154356.1 hypothetical protein [Ralstonia pseudosolanacearum]QIK29779.1 hypothetical protein G7947_16445 [Ralstonia solanacearum]